MRSLRFRGSFYPYEKEEIESFIKENLKKIKIEDKAKLAIVPHAGYIYSGFCALHSYANLDKEVKRVIIFGVDHNGLCNKICVGKEDWEGIFGKIETDKEFIEKISKFENVEINDEIHKYEHSIEVQIPFLEYFLKNFKLVPILINNMSFEEIYDFSKNLSNLLDNETALIFSGDLIHHGEIYGFVIFTEKRIEKVRNADMHIINSILKLNEKEFLELLEFYPTVCGKYTFQAFISFCKILNKKPKLLCYYNSGEITKEEDVIVGYSSIIA
ncbi:MAG: AmmeMemoRadiSam system protein B [Candidatus Aenigmatarchaeota archaeon]